MATISNHYGLSGSLEFLDIELTTDNFLFLDPHAVRVERGPSPFAAQAKRCLTSFFDEIVGCVVSRKRSEAARGLDLLQHFNEPKETRLGMSKKGIDGHGAAEKLGSDIWQVLSSDTRALIRVGVLKWVEDIPLFVEGVDKDITSDLTTRIIFDPLAKFTQAMMKKYPQFTQGGHRSEIVDRQVWSPGRAEWIQKSLDLPIAADRPLLLVPKYWARPWLLMSATRFYNTSMLSFAQEQRGVVDRRTGKLITDPKRVLKRKKELERGTETIVRVTEDAHGMREDLLARFRSFVDQRYERLEDDEIESRLRR
jgi:hypothetical protein